MVAIPRKSQLLELGEGDPQRSNAQLRRKFKDEAPARRLGMVDLCWFANFLRYLQEACQSHPAAFFLVVVIILAILVIQHPFFLIYVLCLCSLCVFVAVLHRTTENARFLP